MARNELKNDKIHIVDSGYVAFILGMMVIRAAEEAAGGRSIPEIIEIIEGIKKEMKVYIIVDTLEFLQKGGRVGKAASLIGGLLNIKPILTITGGEVHPFEKVRGSKKVFGRLSALFSDNIDKNKDRKIMLGFGHASAEERLQQLIGQLNLKYDCSKALISQIGPVVGAHAGPGTLAFCLYPE
jgi:DegV family protein with EDD domain